MRFGGLGRFSIAIGIFFAISACSGEGETAVPESEPDQLTLEVQPIQVCDDGGIVCAQVEFFEAVADKAWGQANVDIAFLPLNQLNDSTYLTTDEDEFTDLSFSGGPGAFGRHPESTQTGGPINLWFVDVIETSSGLQQFGNAWIGLNGVLISDDILDFNDGAGRIDVIAHEIGHNLGLRHSTFGAGEPDNLMSGGGVRAIPSSVDDIYPDGDGLSRLTPEQIEEVRKSNFLQPSVVDEPPLLVTAADAVPNALPLAAASVAVPEGSPTPLAWLLLWPLGQRLCDRKKFNV